MPNPNHDQRGRFAPRNPNQPVAKAAAKKITWRPTDELGVQSRQQRYGTGLFDDFLPQLRGTNLLRVIREMTDNDSTVGAIMFAIDMLLRQAPWSAEPASDGQADQDAALFVEECVGDMEHTWPDHASAALTMLPYGFSWFEQVYRIRRPERGSQFNDGRLGWRKMGFRPQDTLSRWDEDEQGGLIFVQDTGRGELVPIPAAKSVHYKTQAGRGQPEGRSILRNSYRSWWMKKRAEETMLIGLERGLAGLPVIKMPAEQIVEGGAGYERYATMARRLRQDEQMGVVTASDVWPGTNVPMYEVTTLPSAGAPGIDPVETVRMFANDIAASVLASFIYLGRDAVGSRALATPMQEIFQRALETWLDSMEDTFHHQAVLPLLKLNGFQVESPPRWRHGTVQDVDLAGLGQFIQQVAATGYDWGVLNANDPIRDQMRTMAGFDPEPDEFVEIEGPEPDVPPALAAYTGLPQGELDRRQGKPDVPAKRPKPPAKRWDGGKGLWLPR